LGCAPGKADEWPIALPPKALPASRWRGPAQTEPDRRSLSRLRRRRAGTASHKRVPIDGPKIDGFAGAAARTEHIEPWRAGEQRRPDRGRPQHVPAEGKLVIPSLDHGFRLGAHRPGLHVESARPNSHGRPRTPNAGSAIREAELLTRQKEIAGALAFSRRSEPDSGDVVATVTLIRGLPRRFPHGISRCTRAGRQRCLCRCDFVKPAPGSSWSATPVLPISTIKDDS
jgi:hypothetical protein